MKSTIIPRNVKFDWSQSELHWIRDDAFSSHWANEFSYLLTQGEKFFCRVFREALPLVEDPKLRADVEAFIKQEAVHSRAHHDSIEGYLKRLGIDGGDFERHNAVLFDRLLAKDPAGIKLPKSLQRQWLVMRVGIVAAVEHFTSALGTFVLEAKWDEHGADPVVADLFRWHGAEEMEHRNVAYDLYCYLGGKWPLRTLLMAMVYPLMMERATSGIVQLMRQDPIYSKADTKRFSAKFWNHWHRSADRGNTPKVRWFGLHALRFLRAGYHPEYEASTEQALRYIASSPAVLAAA
ncbi:metal-dependent hydrolase [Stenotrophobium rhamnosiphilum]|uniref:Metal-dependent hydrolase n=1 Tax=Stenotrophobium rhamnosiphilum TaxID=2029166 RepID=A0A2T5ME87_9GAMM|nr:metal-dependent hydrolase [Stenotrophobium rhamnosiphilum]PTU30876.1 metal-dependent hydrolase [Stenotrophobium rhamnosiphilum]